MQFTLSGEDSWLLLKAPRHTSRERTEPPCSWCVLCRFLQPQQKLKTPGERELQLKDCLHQTGFVRMPVRYFLDVEGPSPMWAVPPMNR